MNYDTAPTSHGIVQTSHNTLRQSVQCGDELTSLETVLPTDAPLSDEITSLTASACDASAFDSADVSSSRASEAYEPVIYMEYNACETSAPISDAPPASCIEHELPSNVRFVSVSGQVPACYVMSAPVTVCALKKFAFTTTLVKEVEKKAMHGRVSVTSVGVPAVGVASLPEAESEIASAHTLEQHYAPTSVYESTYRTALLPTDNIASAPSFDLEFAPTTVCEPAYSLESLSQDQIEIAPVGNLEFTSTSLCEPTFNIESIPTNEQVLIVPLSPKTLRKLAFDVASRLTTSGALDPTTNLSYTPASVSETMSDVVSLPSDDISTAATYYLESAPTTSYEPPFSLLSLPTNDITTAQTFNVELAPTSECQSSFTIESLPIDHGVPASNFDFELPNSYAAEPTDDVSSSITNYVNPILEVGSLYTSIHEGALNLVLSPKCVSTLNVESRLCDANAYEPAFGTESAPTSIYESTFDARSTFSSESAVTTVYESSLNAVSAPTSTYEQMISVAPTLNFSGSVVASPRVAGMSFISDPSLDAEYAPTRESESPFKTSSESTCVYKPIMRDVCSTRSAIASESDCGFTAARVRIYNYVRKNAAATRDVRESELGLTAPPMSTSTFGVGFVPINASESTLSAQTSLADIIDTSSSASVAFECEFNDTPSRVKASETVRGGNAIPYYSTSRQGDECEPLQYVDTATQESFSKMSSAISHILESGSKHKKARISVREQDSTPEQTCVDNKTHVHSSVRKHKCRNKSRKTARVIATPRPHINVSTRACVSEPHVNAYQHAFKKSSTIHTQNPPTHATDSKFSLNYGSGKNMSALKHAYESASILIASSAPTSPTLTETTNTCVSETRESVVKSIYESLSTNVGKISPSKVTVITSTLVSETCGGKPIKVNNRVTSPVTVNASLTPCLSVTRVSALKRAYESASSFIAQSPPVHEIICDTHEACANTLKNVHEKASTYVTVSEPTLATVISSKPACASETPESALKQAYESATFIDLNAPLHKTASMSTSACRSESYFSKIKRMHKSANKHIAETATAHVTINRSTSEGTRVKHTHESALTYVRLNTFTSIAESGFPPVCVSETYESAYTNVDLRSPSQATVISSTPGCSRKTCKTPKIVNEYKAKPTSVIVTRYAGANETHLSAPNRNVLSATTQATEAEPTPPSRNLSVPLILSIPEFQTERIPSSPSINLCTLPADRASVPPNLSTSSSLTMRVPLSPNVWVPTPVTVRAPTRAQLRAPTNVNAPRLLLLGNGPVVLLRARFVGSLRIVPQQHNITTTSENITSHQFGSSDVQTTQSSHDERNTED